MTKRKLEYYINKANHIQNGFLFYQLSQLENSYVSEWLNGDDAKLMDIEFCLNRSEKTMSPYFQGLVEYGTKTAETEEQWMELYEDVLEIMSSYINNKFGDKWNKLHQAIVEESYNALQNVNITDTETYDVTNTENGYGASTGTEERKNNFNYTVETENQDNVFGFNTGSDDGVPSDKSNGTQTTSGSNEDNVTNVDTGNSYSTHKQNDKDGTITKVKEGNNGTVTFQKLLAEEIKVRSNNLYEIMFKDLDNLICLKIYD